LSAHASTFSEAQKTTHGTTLPAHNAACPFIGL
jgi:hypothetical protein